MISLCLIYSDNRLLQATQVVDYLSYLPYVSTYELLQICDGQPNFVFPSFKAVVVNRTDNDFFCRADLWREAVATANKRVVVILDCDRIAHPSFFGAAAMLQPKHVLYCPHLYQLLKQERLETIVSHFNKSIPHTFARPDFRVVIDKGTIRPAKNPMSGCVAFLKDDYLSTAGLSKEFVGWGFNDTDYYTQVYFEDFVFDTVMFPEFHIYHDYEIPRRILLAMNAWNSVKYYDKWRMPIHNDMLATYEYFRTTPEFIRQTTLQMFLKLKG